MDNFGFNEDKQRIKKMKFVIRTVTTSESTQDIVKEAAIKGDPAGVVVQSLQQSAGRGRHGKAWHSPPGNLYMSLLLRPDCLADEAGQLAFVSALAVSAALDDYLPGERSKFLKWPNDVMVDGKKISGILIETSLVRGRVDYVVIGIGVNISASPKEAVSLDEMNGRENSVEGLRDSILESFQRQYKVWQSRGFGAIKNSWSRQAYGMNQEIVVCLPDSEIKGVFKGMDEKGWLVMEDKSGNERHIKSGQIKFV